MKIAWLTPWTPDSAIAEYSALVTGELARTPGVDVDVWYPAGAGGRTTPAPGNEIGVRTRDRLRDYDAVIYNIGNHLGYHGSIYELSLAVPGTVVLHDVVLTHMFLPQLLQQSDEAMTRILTGWYGPAGRSVVDALREDPEKWLWTDGNTSRFPMLEPALEGASQVVTHSRYAASVVRERYVGDVHTFGLPALHWPDPTAPRPSFDWLDERPVVLQAGAVNPNKCVPEIIEAFRDHGLGDHLQLVIAGHMPNGDRLRMQQDVARWGLTSSVRVLGTVDDATMQDLRQIASIATVLRSPVTESSSAVLVDSMVQGLAIVALDVGHYREHPRDVVELLPAPPTAAAVAELLGRWATRPDLRAQRGEAAATYAARHHSAPGYAAQLLGVLGHRGSARRREALATAAAGLVARNGFGPRSELARRVADQAVFLFAKEPRRGRP